MGLDIYNGMAVWGAPGLAEKLAEGHDDDDEGGYRSNIMFYEGDFRYNPASLLFKNRIIRLDGAVSEASCKRLQEELLALDSLTHKGQLHEDITLYINSPGGYVTQGFMVYDTMQQIKSPVCTVVTGIAMSMGSILMVAGEKGKRYALPHASVMLHESSGGTYGRSSSRRIWERWSEDLLEQLIEVYVKHVNRDEDGMFSAYGGDIDMGYVDEMEPKKMDEDEFREWFNRWLKFDRPMTAQMALKLGLIDGILKPGELPHYKLLEEKKEK